jgi:hypothetical protein
MQRIRWLGLPHGGKNWLNLRAEQKRKALQQRLLSKTR